MSNSLQQSIKQELAKLEAANLLRSDRSKIFDTSLENFSSNDYLAFNFKPFDQHKAQEFLSQYSLGSTGSRLTTGTHAVHLELEDFIAKSQGTQAAMFFGSGYLTNLGALASLLSSRDLVLSDELNHSCLNDGVKLSKARKTRYAHLDYAELESLLQQHRGKYDKAFIVSDYVFSMDGDKLDLARVLDLCERYDAILYLDKAHDISFETLPVSDRLIQMGTFSKAIGLEGGYVAGTRSLIDFLKNKARTFVYSTAPSPFIAAMILYRLSLIYSQFASDEFRSINAAELAELDQRRKQLKANIASFRLKLEEAGLEFTNEDSAIFAIFVGDVDETLGVASQMIEQGVWVTAIRPPTVDRARLRVCVNALAVPEFTC